jgi:hypothetical protein
MDEVEAFLDECRADPWFQPTKKGSQNMAPKLLHSGRNRGRARRLTGMPSGELGNQRRGLRDFEKFRGEPF